MAQQRQVSYFGEEDMSRLEEFMARMEAGQPYGNQGDIDMLLDEVVKRLERRVIAKIDDLQINVQLSASANSSPVVPKKSLPASQSSPPSTPKKIRRITKAKPPLEPNMDLLNHDVQDLVQDIVMTSMERLISETNMVEQDESDTVFRPSRVISEGKKTQGAVPDKEAMTRYTKGTVKAMMFTATASDEEEDSNDTFGMTTHVGASKGRSAVADRNVQRSTKRPTSSDRTGASNRKVLERLGGKEQNVNTNYTYTLRSSVRRAIPKYLGQDGTQSKAAVMHMFNAIRFAMADESIESIVVEALGEAFSSKNEEQKSGKKNVERNLVREKAGAKTAGRKQADGGRRYFENRSWSPRDASQGPQAGIDQFGSVGMPKVLPQHDAKDSYAQRDKRVNYKAGKTDGTPTRRKTSWNSFSHYVQKGSPEDAVMSMADSILAERFPEGWNQQDLDYFFGYDEQGKAIVSESAPKPSILKKQKVTFAEDKSKMPNTIDSWKTATKHIGEATMRYDSNMTYLIRKALKHAIPKFTNSKIVSGALLHLSEKLMDEFPLQQVESGSLPLSNATTEFNSEKEQLEDLPWVSRGNDNISNESEDVPWVSKGNNQKPKTTTSTAKASEEMPWVTKGQNAKSTTYKSSQDVPWVTKGEIATSIKVTNDSSRDLPWVSRGNALNDQKRTSTPANELPPKKASVGTQTSLRALYDEYDVYPQTVTAGRGWNKNTNQSADTISLCSEESIHEEIFYDALSSHADFHIKSDQDGEMSFLKRFRLNLLFRKKKNNEKKFVSAVHKVIDARRSGCIDDDGNFVQGLPTPSPKKEDGKKSPPPAVKPKPKKTLDKNGNQQQQLRTSRKRGSRRRQHNPDRESYPLPEEDDGSEGYASASEMDNYEFNPTAFLERNRRSAENRFHRDDGTEADVDSDSDGANSANRRVRFSDDVQHFGEIAALGETESSDNLEDEGPDSSLMSLKSKIELFEKVSSNEFLDERSFQGSPPPDIPDNVSLPTKDRVQLFEDISKGKKPTTCSESNAHKIPRRAVESCQYTLTKSKISFFEQLGQN